MSLTKAGTIVRIDSRKGATMNLNLSDWDWLNAALGNGIFRMQRHKNAEPDAEKGG